MARRITKQYNPRELEQILKIMEESFDEVRPMTSIVIGLYQNGYKIVKLDVNSTIELKTK